MPRQIREMLIINVSLYSRGEFIAHSGRQERAVQKEAVLKY